MLAGQEPPPRAAGAFHGLKAPVWPEDVLPPIDRALAARGGTLYAEMCQGCHRPPGSEVFWQARYWTEPNFAEHHTTLRGNRNTGHEFRDGLKEGGVIGRRLSVEERRALIEYLKSL